MEAFILSAVEQGVMTITLNRPDRLNSFNDLMHHQLAECLKQAERDDGVRCLLITGAGRGFCAGQDLNDRNVDPSGPPPDLGMSVERFYNPLVRRLAALPKPVICAVNGVAAGAGATLALGCDIVLAARSAKFVMAFSKLGLVPDCGGSWFLPRVAGRARAMGLALLGDSLSAEQAAQWGLSTFGQSAALAEKARAKRLWLVHYSPMITAPEEHLAQAQSIFPAAECGFDGKRITLHYEENEE